MTKVYVVKNKECGTILGIFKRKQDADLLWKEKCKIFGFGGEEYFGIERHKVERGR